MYGSRIFTAVSSRIAPKTRKTTEKREIRTAPTAMKMVLGLVLLGIGFLFLVFAGRYVDRGMQVSAIWLTLAYLFHTLGEICLSPVGLSYVTKVAPYKFAFTKTPATTSTTASKPSKTN